MDVFEKVIPFEVNDHCREQIKKSLKFRFLKFPEDLEKCTCIGGMVVFKKGDSLGYFNHDHSKFHINEHWSDRMRAIEGNPIPVCCGFKMSPGGVGMFKNEELAWQCSFCNKTIPSDEN